MESTPQFAGLGGVPPAQGGAQQAFCALPARHGHVLYTASDSAPQSLLGQPRTQRIGAFDEGDRHQRP